MPRAKIDGLLDDGLPSQQSNLRIIPKPEIPTQNHHFATNKNSIWTPKLESIVKQCGLELNGTWNKQLLPHIGRHPNAYHNFVYQGMKRAALEAGRNQNRFLQLFNLYVKEPVINNPQLLRGIGWK